MQTLRLTKQDFDAQGKYIGKTDVSDYQGHIEIDAGLGRVSFKGIRVSGYLWAKAGTGIKADTEIKAGTEIEAGEGIEAGKGIEAGEGIKAGTGIQAGLSITCKKVLKFSTRLFAGTCYWRQLEDDSEKTITCGRLEGDKVCYGIVKEIGM